MLSKDKQFQDLLARLDALIKAGRAAEVRAELRALTSKKPPREQLLPLATLARRADFAAVGLRLLNPVVRPHRKNLSQATEAEKVEYAFCLSNNGAYQEALQLLNSVDPKKAPQSLLAKSFCYVAVWDYTDALPVLREYCKTPDLTPYQLLVGEANLLAALVAERKAQEAETLVLKLIENCKEQKSNFLLGKMLSLRAQNAIHSGLWDKAPEMLKEASEHLKGTGGVDLMLINKWHAVYDCHLSKGSSESIQKLRAVRNEAVRIRHWENIRHCDAYEAIFTKNEKLALHLCFGTPYHRFRKSFLADYGEKLEFPDNYLLKLGESSKASKEIDVLVSDDFKGNGFKGGMLSYRILLALASDFYRPLRVTSLHYAMYPESYFNPVSSPDRVHQALRRLRHELKERHVPILIQEDKGLYSLSASQSILLKVPRENEPKTRFDFQIEMLQQNMQERPFAVSEAAKLLDIAIPTALILLQKALAQETLVRTGKGRACRYHFKNNSVQKAAA